MSQNLGSGPDASEVVQLDRLGAGPLGLLALGPIPVAERIRAAVKELKLSYHNTETILFTTFK